MDTIIEFDIPQDRSANLIKVIGVGGGGGNAVENMYKQGVCDVSFAVCNTDSQALVRSSVPVRIQLGEEGLGVGGKPEKGKQAAEESIGELRRLFDDETEMVFVTAGMGGGTGTGAGPVIAGIAKEMGELTVGIVTIPFAFEKKVRIQKALQGVEMMRENVDALLVINNERLRDIYDDGITTVEQGFSKADEVLTVATKSIAEIITIKGIVNRDFCDVHTVMKDGGSAIMSTGRASGEHRLEKAMYEALKSPLLDNVDIEKSQKLLYIIYSCDDCPVTMSEITDVNNFMDSLSSDIEVLWGLYRDNTLGEDVKVTIIATGFDRVDVELPNKKNDDVKQERLNELMEYYYGKKKKVPSVEDSKLEPEPMPEPEPETDFDSDSEPMHVDPIVTPSNGTSWLERLKILLENTMGDTFD